MKNKSAIRQYFYFTRTERIGIATLALLCTASLLSPRIYRWWFPPPITEPMGPTPRLAHLSLPEASAGQEFLTEAVEKPASLFSFDPNTASESDFQALGLPPRTVKSILNFRNKGGKFRTPEDLARIYTLSEHDFQRLQPWVVLPSTRSRNDQPSAGQAPPPVLHSFDPNTVTEEDLRQMGIATHTAKGWLNYLAKGGRFKKPDDLRKLYGLSESEAIRLLPFVAINMAPPKNTPAARGGKPIDINTAEADDWAQLPGIGAGWARKIMAYRDKLGGFVHPKQVAETRSLPDSVYQRILPYLTTSQARYCTRIPINTASWEDLNAHPYIEARQARWIVAYREQHGPYHKPEDLLRIPELKTDWLEKIRPYLAF